MRVFRDRLGASSSRLRAAPASCWSSDPTATVRWGGSWTAARTGSSCTTPTVRCWSFRVVRVPLAVAEALAYGEDPVEAGLR